MSIETAEKLKNQLTDKHVVVKPGIPELRRFASLTGVVKTVNMSGRALVQFDGPADIGWYDIDPEFLTVVDAPAKAAAAEKHAAPVKSREEMKSAAPAAAKPAGKSPLELARAQGAAGATKTGGVAPASAADSGTVPPAKKLSPLELARQQGAVKSGGPAAAAPVAEKQAASTSQPAKKMSPLEIARMQGAVKESCLSAPAAAPPPEVTAPTLAVAPAANSAPASASPVPVPPIQPAEGKKLSPLELARQQGAFKRDNG